MLPTDGGNNLRFPGSGPGALDISLDRTSPVPLYHQFAQQLERAIERGQVRPGALLDNEVELAGRLGLSRPTIRHGIQTLVDKGLLIRRRGVGTQVVCSTVRRPLALSSLHDDLQETGQEPSTRVLKHDVVPAPPEVAAALGIPPGSSVVRLERIRYAGGLAVACLRNYLPTGLLYIDGERLESTGLYRLLRAAGVHLHSAHQAIGARTANAQEGEYLGAAEGVALLTVQRIAYDAGGRAVEYGTHLYHAARYSFEFQLLVRA